MKEFEVYLDENLNIWRQLKVVVKANTKEEAKKLALDPINHECSEVTEYYWETIELVKLENTEDPCYQEPKEILKD